MTSISRIPQGTTVYFATSDQGRAILARQRLDLVSLAKAIAAYQNTEKVPVATCIGVHETLGFVYSTEPEWHPDHPDAFAKPFGNIPWVQIHELLGHLPAGSTEDYLNSDGNTH
jgi:hypothetical protein